MLRPERLALAVLLLFGVTALWVSTDGGGGPVEPRWDHERCARCGMLLSEPRFAAQIQLADGRVLHFDDPGCLFAHEAASAEGLAGARAVWFHDSREPRWLSLDEVGFAPIDHTPMDFGLAAVAEAETPGAVSGAQAFETVRRQLAGDGEPHARGEPHDHRGPDPHEHAGAHEPGEPQP